MPKAKMNIAASSSGHGDDDEIDEEGDDPARQHALEQFRAGARIVGMRLDVDRHGMPSGNAGASARGTGSEMEKIRADARGGRLERRARLRHGARRESDLSVTVKPTSRPPAASFAGAVLRTPMLPAPKLSALTGAEVYVKYENLQVTNSFKDRGALVKLSSLGEAERARGVIAMSAGNHAQAVAYHAARLGIPATIVMPVTTPFVKVAATRSHGAEVVLHGETRSPTRRRAVEQLVAERG